MSKKWFKAKHYGYGWYPSSWQGWSLTVAFSASIIILSLILRVVIEDKITFLFTYLIIVLIEGLLFYSVLKNTAEALPNMSKMIDEPVKKKTSITKKKVVKVVKGKK